MMSTDNANRPVPPSDAFAVVFHACTGAES